MFGSAAACLVVVGLAIPVLGLLVCHLPVCHLLLLRQLVAASGVVATGSVAPGLVAFGFGCVSWLYHIVNFKLNDEICEDENQQHHPIGILICLPI